MFPVGRLDADTEGLLILTNDGDLAHRLTHPRFGVEKEYLAEVEGEPTPPTSAGSGRASSSTTARRRRPGFAARRPTMLRIAIHEGRNRQVRRMCDAVGHPVERLVRTRIRPGRRPPARAGPVAAAHGPKAGRSPRRRPPRLRPPRRRPRGAPGWYEGHVEIEVVIEIPKGTRNKYEADPDTGTIWLDRMLFTSTRYPEDYGYVP